MATVHVIGAGVSGLAAAIEMADAGVRVTVHEAAGVAGGRCRSYPDDRLGMTIDNGNHVLLSANDAARGYLSRIGAADRMQPARSAIFPFVDLASGARWTLDLGTGRLPWPMLSRHARVPGASLADYARPLSLIGAGEAATVAQRMSCKGAGFERLWRPLLLAALDTEPREASAACAARLLRETVWRGGAACRPMIASHGLAATLIDPAVAALRAKGGSIRYGRRLRAVTFEATRARALHFADETLRLAPHDGVVLAVPPWVAAGLVPGLCVPDDFRAIVNVHFKYTAPPHAPGMLGVINATSEWIFAYSGRISVTISAADRLLDADRQTLARTIWREVAGVLACDGPLPPWQIVKERRATIAATPAQEARRPPAATAFANLALAGDWVATGLPATIEGAVRAGRAAARCVLEATGARAGAFA